MIRHSALMVVLLSLASRPLLAQPMPTNVILIIGDGMGRNQIDAARMFDNGNTLPLTFEQFPFQAQVSTLNVFGDVTDSAAAATAMATGVKVGNGVISTALPGSGAELTTSLEILQSRGKSAGLVTTFTPITDATPAGFGAHVPFRFDQSGIANDYFTQTRPNVLMGDIGGGASVANAALAGYQTVTNSSELLALNPNTSTFVYGEFSDPSAPSLALRTRVALDVLDNDPDGFFLLIEHEGTDELGHANNLAGVIDSLLELRDAVNEVMTWSQGRNDTLILVTGDHETGGLTAPINNGAGVLPTASYTTSGHTDDLVPIFATGPGAAAVVGILDNTDLFAITASVPEPSGILLLFVPCAGLATWARSRFARQE